MTQIATFAGGRGTVTPGFSLPNAFLSFSGKDPHTGETRKFDVLCGQNPPTPTGGYAEWTDVPRPLQRPITVPKDFTALTMTCDVIFGSWLGQYGLPQGWQQDDNTGQRVEQDISSLEWMAGAGGNNGIKSGQAPWVYVTAYSKANDKAQSGLIPVRYRGLPWTVTNLQWGQSWRNSSAYRIYQEATITLTNFLSLTPAGTVPTREGGSWFVSSPGRDTALSIAASPSIASPTVDLQTVARSILTASENNPCKGTRIRLKRRSVNWTIRHGVHIYVPAHTIA